MNGQFPNRRVAGRMLAERLRAYADRSDVLVLGLPRGGVPVAYELAKALNAELDVLIVRKLGMPGHPELAMGAIASGGTQYLNEEVLRYGGVGRHALQAVLEEEQAELVRREKLYRGTRAPLKLAGRTVIVVDDGMATGASMRAAVMALRSGKPSKIVVAVPVAPADAADRLQGAADEFVCVQNPVHFYAVGQFYKDFEQTSDEEVRELLENVRQVPV
ncbi:MAG: phosphoribosyltransferase [Bacillota bacterium]